MGAEDSNDASKTAAGRTGQLQFTWPKRPRRDKCVPQPPRQPSVREAATSAPDDKTGASEPTEEPTTNESHDPSERAYDPGLPWHYYRKGDAAPPIPFDAIPPSEQAGTTLAGTLPKTPAKRIIKLRELLDAERRCIEQARARYEDVIARGAEALSDYDRRLSYGGDDELARAGALALLYNQISGSLGRIPWLEREQSRGSARSR